MPKKTFTPEKIVGKLRQIEVLVSHRNTVPLACKDSGITDDDGRSELPSWTTPALISLLLIRAK